MKLLSLTYPCFNENIFDYLAPPEINTGIDKSKVKATIVNIPVGSTTTATEENAKSGDKV